MKSSLVSDIDTDSVLCALDAVEAVRRKGEELDESLPLPARKAALKEKLAESYRQQQIEVDDSTLEQGVNDFFDSRLSYIQPVGGLAALVGLAGFYHKRILVGLGALAISAVVVAGFVEIVAASDRYAALARNEAVVQDGKRALLDYRQMVAALGIDVRVAVDGKLKEGDVLAGALAEAIPSDNSALSQAQLQSVVNHAEALDVVSRYMAAEVAKAQQKREVAVRTAQAQEQIDALRVKAENIPGLFRFVNQAQASLDNGDVKAAGQAVASCDKLVARGVYPNGAAWPPTVLAKQSGFLDAGATTRLTALADTATAAWGGGDDRGCSFNESGVS